VEVEDDQELVDLCPKEIIWHEDDDLWTDDDLKELSLYIAEKYPDASFCDDGTVYINDDILIDCEIEKVEL
jgi:hypothetical protein